MAKAQNIAFTTLSEEDALILDINGVKYDIAQFIASFQLNGIPQATCILAVGSNARRVEELATIHDTAASLTTMLPAKVIFHARGQYDTSGKEWPDEAVVIFEGYFTGFSYNKERGKVSVQAGLVHWLVDLGFSSTFSSILQPPSMGSLSYAAVTRLLESSDGVSLADAQSPGGAGSGSEPAFVPGLIGYSVVQPLVAVDLWVGIKDFLCALASYAGYTKATPEGCLGDFDPRNNTRALNALGRIEGPAKNCNLAYKYAAPLPLDVGDLGVIADAVTEKVASAAMDQFISQTFWDVLVGHYGTLFNMDIVPMVDRALVVGSVHAPRLNAYWRTLRPEDYVSINTKSTIPKPLRGVAMFGQSTTDAGYKFTEEGTGEYSFSGCFGSDAQEDADGSLLIITPPSWLTNVPVIAPTAGASAGITGQKPNNSATTPEAGNTANANTEPSGSQTFGTVSAAMSRYAHSVFVNNMLRGRSGEISGRLRFDIAPGSHLKIEGSPEVFLGAEDALAASMFVRVHRVTIEINAETGMAATSFGVMSVRSEKENTEDRTSVDRHPLFSAATVVPGAPLVSALELGEGETQGISAGGAT